MAINVKASTAPNKAAVAKPPEGEVRHYVSDSKKPLKVKVESAAEGQPRFRMVNYGEHVPEATAWKPNIQAANIRMGIIRRVDNPPAAVVAAAQKELAAVAAKKAAVKAAVAAKAETPSADKSPAPSAGVTKPDDDPMFSDAKSGALKGK